LGLVSLDGLHRGSIIDSPPVLCDSIHTITCGSMEEWKIFICLGEQRISPQKKVPFLLKMQVFGDGMVVDMQIFAVTTMKTSSPCLICSGCMPWASYIRTTFCFTDSRTSRT